MSKHIAIFIPSLEGGGAERVMVNLANGLAERGYQIDLVLAKASGPYLKDVSGKVNIVDLDNSRVLFSLPKLVKYLRKEMPRVILSAMAHANVVAVLASKLSGIQVRSVVSERAHFSTSVANATSLRSKFLSFLVKWAYPRADGIIAVSSGVAEDIKSVLGLRNDQVVVVFNPVAIPGSETIIKRPEHAWFKDDDLPVVVGMGRLVPQKDFKTLISAFSEIRKHREIRLAILGDGPQKTETQSLINNLGLEDSVELLGFIDDPRPFLKYASVFVLSSRWEGFPNVLVETMALGTPVVSTDCPSGPFEILEAGKWGQLVSMGDVHGMARAITETIENLQNPDVKSRASDFSLNCAVDGYLRVLLPDSK